MKQLQSISHTVWECKYHIVWIPKYRKKVLYGKIREELVGVFHELANRRGCKILEGHLCVDHVHMLLLIPPKYGVAEVVGYLDVYKRQGLALIGGGNFGGHRLLGQRGEGAGGEMCLRDRSVRNSNRATRWKATCAAKFL